MREEEPNNHVRMLARHEIEVGQLNGEMQRLRRELKAKSLQIERANYLHSEALTRLGAVVQEFGALSQHFKKEMVLLRKFSPSSCVASLNVTVHLRPRILTGGHTHTGTNVARAVGMAFVRFAFRKAPSS